MRRLLSPLALAWLSLLGGAGCESAPPPGPPPPARCEALTGVRVEAATVADRRILGTGDRYPADSTLRARQDELARSQRARRAAAWEVVARVLAPVAPAEPLPLSGASVPRFRTWLDREDLSRLFHHLYTDLGPEGRRARARFDEASLDAALLWNVDAIEALDTWPEERWDAYIASLDEPIDVQALGGIRRIGMSPDLVRHLLASYPDIIRCMNDGAPPGFVDTPSEATRRMLRERVELAGCGTHEAGPFFVARGERLGAVVEGLAPEHADLRVESIDDPAMPVTRCLADAPEGCEVEGPGIFRVSVLARADAIEGMLEVDHTAPDPTYAACLAGAFPDASASVAAEWRRADVGWPLPTFDTTASGLARRLADGQGATWGEGDGEADPGPDAIYTVRASGGETFRLAGMHIRTREVDRWVHITLWWSPTPDSDFGADRPESIRSLGGPWANYQMCVATEFDELDPDPTGGFGDSSLGAALRVVHGGVGSPTWCSNPYIDGAPGLARGNCVGCHQHAMSGVRPGEVATDPLRYPDSGRTEQRNNFPADYFWGLDAGDDLANVLRDEVLWWDTAP